MRCVGATYLPTTCDDYSDVEIMVSCVAVFALAVAHESVGENSYRSMHQGVPISRWYKYLLQLVLVTAEGFQ